MWVCEQSCITSFICFESLEYEWNIKNVILNGYNYILIKQIMLDVCLPLTCNTCTLYL